MPNEYRVMVTDFVCDELAPERRVLSGIADLIALDAAHERDMWGRVEQADALMAYHSLHITRATLERLQRCRVIVRCGVGYDNIDIQFARHRGIAVANIPDYGTEEVADTAIGMALALARGIHVLNSLLRAEAGPWVYSQAGEIVRLRGRTFGIVGLGRIGTATALRAKTLGMEVVFYDPYKPDGYDKALGIRHARQLEELLGRSHIVSMHCPHTPETHHIINAAAIAQMPRGSFLVNTARGAVVDTSAIPDAIATGHLAGAAIDVFPIEPPPADEPLVAAWRNPDHPAHHRVLLNAHAAFYSEEGLHEMRTKGADVCRCAILGEPLRNVVN
jgi:D-3-phosphoglycerate dehydrogenase/C-terminal binding protein